MSNYTIIQNSDITSYLSDKAFRLYSLLQSMAYNDKIQVYPSQKYMAVALRCSIRTIQRKLDELKRFGLISIRRRGSTSSLITLLQKKITQTVEKVKEAVKVAKNAYNANKSNNRNATTNYTKKQEYFNAFEQRNYNFNKLEELLRGGEGELSDCLLE